MSCNIIHDEGSGLSTAFRKGKSLSQQLREERERLFALPVKPRKVIIKKNKVSRYRPKITDLLGDVKSKCGFFIKRAQKINFEKPYIELGGLEVEILSHFPTKFNFRSKLRHQEIADAKTLFIFFSLLYLGLSSRTIAEYLDLDRSTLSHHCTKAILKIDADAQYQQIAQAIDQYLYERACK
jgi:hypothetical protein